MKDLIQQTVQQMGEWRTPTDNSPRSLVITKRNEITKNNRDNIKAETDTLMMIYQHWIDVGSDKHNLTGNKEANKQNLERWYRELVVENNYFPDELPIKDVLEKFFRAITHGSHTINGFNLRSYIQAFHSWWHKNADSVRGQLAKPIKLQIEAPRVDNVDAQLKHIYKDEIPAIFHKYVTGKSILNK